MMMHGTLSRREAVTGLAALAVTSPVVVTAQSQLPSYYRSFTDFDGFILAIGSDLRAFRRLTGKRDLPMLKEISDTAHDVHRRAVVPTEDGWLFQPGAYADHPDFQHAGVSSTAEAGVPRKVAGIGWDSSHFSRWPLWLVSLEEGAGPGSAAATYFRRLREGLAGQLLTRVVVPPGDEFPTYRFRNYMDGTNGLFRWRADAPAEAYGPYQLSGTGLYGWWAFLDVPEVRSIYAHISDQLPFSAANYERYAGPAKGLTGRQAKHLTRLASRLSFAAKDRLAVGVRDLADWQGFEAALLKRPLWRGLDAQEAAYFLMVPLHIAFLNGVAEWQTSFAAHFRAFAAAGMGRQETRLLDELHYLNLAARFIVLVAQTGHSALVPRGLASMIETRLAGYWHDAGEVVSNTGWGEPAFKGFGDYLRWKLRGD